MRLSFVIAAAVVVGAAPVVSAQVVFSQNFDALPVGIPAAGVPGFTGNGVEVVQSGSLGITCAGGAGKCLDLAGLPGPGTITSTGINVLAGRNITISYELSGNQRDLASDTFSFDVFFAVPPINGAAGAISGPASYIFGFFTAVTGGVYTEVLDGDRAFLTYSGLLNLTANNTIFLRFSGLGGDDVNIGPILDNVLVSQSAIPEPTNWAMLIAGFGLVGAASRRRRAVAA